MQIKGMKTYGHWGPTPLGYGGGFDPRNLHFGLKCYCAKFGHSFIL